MQSARDLAQPVPSNLWDLNGNDEALFINRLISV